MSSHSAEGGVRPERRTPPSPLAVYLVVVCGLGISAIALTVVFTDWPTIAARAGWPAVVFLAIAAIVGEVKPIQLVLGGANTRNLSTSAPFVLALVAVVGVGPAIVVQTLASLTDDLLNRREFRKSLFNTSQYALSVLAAGAVYTALSGTSAFAGTAGESVHLGALLAAGVVMVAVNWQLVAGVVSLATGQSVIAVLRTDAKQTLLTNLVLLSVGGVAAVVAADGLAPLVLLAGPVLAAHLFAATAARHAYEASHDSLTGLGNRGQMDVHLAALLAASDPRAAEGPSLVLLDLDHFKDVNDALGHPVGDRILCEVAARLVAAAPEDSSVHRLGGDEFAVVVSASEGDVHATAERLLASLDLPIQVETLGLMVRASAGVVVAPHHGTDPETLMKNADIALYHAKIERDRISAYSSDFDVNSVERLQLLADLRTALDAGALHVVFQPQVDLGTGRTVAAEALVRWDRADGTAVPPDEFIPLAENSGLIFPLTDFVLNTALAEAARWRALGHELRLAVNLSARHLSDVALVHQVDEALRRNGVPPEALVLEVTETGIFTDAIRADAVLRSVRELGVEISIDDYGTGNASLSYLRRLEIDELKVDRSFVTHISDDDHDRIIVRSTVELALALGLRVVAEGVEDEKTAVALAHFGRVIGQGYHLGEPASAAHLVTRLDEEAATISASAGRDG